MQQQKPHHQQGYINNWNNQRNNNWNNNQQKNAWRNNNHIPNQFQNQQWGNFHPIVKFYIFNYCLDSLFRESWISFEQQSTFPYTATI